MMGYRRSFIKEISVIIHCWGVPHQTPTRVPKGYPEYPRDSTQTQRQTAFEIEVRKKEKKLGNLIGRPRNRWIMR